MFGRHQETFLYSLLVCYIIEIQIRYEWITAQNASPSLFRATDLNAFSRLHSAFRHQLSSASTLSALVGVEVKDHQIRSFWAEWSFVKRNRRSALLTNDANGSPLARFIVFALTWYGRCFGSLVSRKQGQWLKMASEFGILERSGQKHHTFDVLHILTVYRCVEVPFNRPS